MSLGKPITTPGLSFSAAKAGILNAYTPVFEASYNFADHFRVLSSRRRDLLQWNQGYVLDVSHGVNNQYNQMIFYSDGDHTSIVAATLVNMAAATRGILDKGL